MNTRGPASVSTGKWAQTPPLSAQSAFAVGVAETFLHKRAPCHGQDGIGQSNMAKKLGVKDLTVATLIAAEAERCLPTLATWVGRSETRL